MLRKPVPPMSHAPAVQQAETETVHGGLGQPKPKARRTRKVQTSVPLTGERPILETRLPDLVRYETVDGRVRRRWVPGFTRRGPGVPEGWMEDGSPEDIAARKLRERQEFHLKALKRQASRLPYILAAGRRKKWR